LRSIPIAKQPSKRWAHLTLECLEKLNDLGRDINTDHWSGQNHSAALEMHTFRKNLINLQKKWQQRIA